MQNSLSALNFASAVGNGSCPKLGVLDSEEPSSRSYIEADSDPGGKK